MNYRAKIKLKAELIRDTVFSAILLDEGSKKALFDRFPPKFKNIQDGHITLQFRPKTLPDNLGEKVNFTVYGYAKDNKADAVSVKLYDVVSNNEIPHITLSVNQDVKPVYSNELLSRGYEAVEPFDLTGQIAVFTRSQGYVVKPPEPEIPREPIFNESPKNETPQI